MGKIFELTGKTTATKFRQIEKTLQHMLRRLHKTVTFAASPIPVSSFIEQAKKGDIFLRYLAPRGEIKSFTFYFELDGAPSTEVQFRVTFAGDKESFSKDFGAKPNRANKARELVKVSNGTRVSIELLSDVTITNVWCGFLLELDFKEYSYEQKNITQIELLYDKEIKEVRKVIVLTEEEK